jgi:hypothetical protein
VNRGKLTQSATFGAFDGASSLLGVILYLLGHQHLIFPAALSGAISSALSMGAGEWLSDNDCGLGAAGVMAASTFAGALAPAVPFAFFTGPPAIAASVTIAVCIGIAVAFMRTGRSRPRALLETLGLLAVIFGVCLALGLVLPGSAALSCRLRGPIPAGRRVLSLYQHVPHPHLARRKETGPVTTAKVRGPGINARIGLAITTLVGTMVCGYVFALIALLSLPSAITSHNLTIIIAWVSSNFLQLVLLPVIIVGQNIQAKASDARAEQTYQDAESVLHEALQIQAHLQAQDVVLERLIGQVSPPPATVPVPTAAQQKESGS